MTVIVLEYSEFLSVLDLLGVRTLVGLEESQLPHPEENELRRVLQEGYEKLVEHEWLRVRDQTDQLDGELRSMIEVLAQPEAVVRTIRETPEGGEEWSSHAVAGSSIVKLAPAGPGKYQLTTVPDTARMLAEVEQMLPLVPVPDTVHYMAVADQEDAEAVRALAASWEVVPALSIMEADGLNTAEAINLFDDVAEPKWRGRVDFFACPSGEIDKHHRLLALQGQERSWLARQTKPDESTLFIQAATAGALESLLNDYWAEVSTL